MDGIPVVIFDTSAINHLSKEQYYKGLVAALRHGFYTRVLATNFEEVAATVRSEERRALLLSVSRSLLAGGDCILPFNWLLEQHSFETLSTFTTCDTRTRWRIACIIFSPAGSSPSTSYSVRFRMFLKMCGSTLPWAAASHLQKHVHL
jgi:hypothetical protein